MRVLSYHERVKGETRRAVIDAAMEVFLELGYAGASLQQIANRAGVSTATLYKRSATKALLFEAVIPEAWLIAGEHQEPVEPGNPLSGLRMVGEEFASICQHPKFLGLYRMFIAEAPQFPELGKAMLERGKIRYVNRIQDYLDSESEAGNLRGWDNARAASQFFGLITDQLFWPILLVSGSSVTSEFAKHAVDEAVSTILARYERELSSVE